MDSALRVAYVGSYPPRACGIATFTRELSDAVALSGRNVLTRIAAINDEGATYQYPPQMRWAIDQCDPQSWRDAAEQINASPVSLVSVQHEFGICGRFERDGHFVDHLAGFLARIAKPLVSTLHTVLPHPHPDLRDAIRLLDERSAAVVTMVNMGRLILEEEYGLDPAKLVTIPHGVPEVRRAAPETIKRAMRLDGRTILSTFGLLSSGKGIQYAIRALPEVIGRHPDVLYLVIGETHPEVRRREGERYRNALIELVKKLGLSRHVRFVNRYLPQRQVIRYLQATDIYLTPYVDRYQITSGTLAYALGCGKAAISTPYLYAAEALAEGRGLLAGFEDPGSFARCITMLLENQVLRERCESGAFAYGRQMSWGKVGARYADLFHATAGNTAHPVSSGAADRGQLQLIAGHVRPGAPGTAVSRAATGLPVR